MTTTNTAYTRLDHAVAADQINYHRKDSTMTTTDHRAFVNEMLGKLHDDEDRAFTVFHAGQLTVANYKRLDRVDPWEMTTPLAQVLTRRYAKRFECIGLDDSGWLVRAELSDADVAGLHRVPRIMALFDLPYMRLVDDTTGYAHPDPRASQTCTPRRAKVMNVPSPSLDVSGAALNPEEVSDDTSTHPH